MEHLPGQTDTNIKEHSLTDSKQDMGSIITRMGTATRECSRGASSTARASTGETGKAGDKASQHHVFYSWSNGAKYVGEHDLDQRTGFGTMIYPDGAEFSGIWENGVHVKFQDSPNQTATTTTTVRPITTTTAAEETTQPRRRKKVMRKKKGGRPRSSTEEENDSPKPKRRKRRKQRKQRKSRNGQLRRRKSQD